MSGRDLTRDERDAMRAQLEDAGLCAMLQTLSELCSDKGQYARLHLQDATSAHAWNTAGGILGLASCDKYVTAIGKP